MTGDSDKPTIMSGAPAELPPTIADDEAGRRMARTIRQDEGDFYGVERGIAYDTKTKVIGGPPRSFAWLVVMNGPWAGRIFTLDPKGTGIGRDAENDIILDDDAVSRFHAKLRVEEDEEGQDRFFVQDLASANGTIVNGEQVTKEFLGDGDSIEIGETKLVFKRV